MQEVDKKQLRNLPAVDEVMRHKDLLCLVESYPRQLVINAVRELTAQYRQRIMKGQEVGGKEELLNLIIQEVIDAVKSKMRPNLRRVINCTGVVLHTNLGRAIMSKEALAAVHMAGSGYSNLEFSLETGKRGSRYAPLEGLLTELTGAESALVVNNNAAAVLLALSTMARGKEVIVSRGQLVEIGGSFRIPEVMAQSGCKLVEVGATNKTHPKDYKKAISDNTALLLYVHTSNYRIVGFTRETSIAELVQIGKQFELPVMCDLGSGCLVELSRYGLDDEPTVQSVVQAGADIVTFSGDKLLGGPQAGIIIGKRKYLEKMRKNPLNRAVRIDKMTVAALESTLRIYREEEKAINEIPALKMLTIKTSSLREKAEDLATRLQDICPEKLEVNLQEGFSQVGGGAMPILSLNTFVVALRPLFMTTEQLAELLRIGEPSIIGRIQDDWLLLDVRTIQSEEIPDLVAGIKNALSI